MMRVGFRGLGLVLLPAVALAVFAGQGPAVETRTFKLTYASAVEVGAPAGSMNVVNGYPRGFNETNEHERESDK